VLTRPSAEQDKLADIAGLGSGEEESLTNGKSNLARDCPMLSGMP